MRVFDRRLVRRHRDRSAARLSAHDFLLREVADRLCERLLDVPRRFPLPLARGCHARAVSAALDSLRFGVLQRLSVVVDRELSGRAFDARRVGARGAGAPSWRRVRRGGGTASLPRGASAVVPSGEGSTTRRSPVMPPSP